MDTTLPPVPADLWPTVSATVTCQMLGRGRLLHISPASVIPHLEALTYAIQTNMQSAGKWAARPNTHVTRLDSPRLQFRSFADDAARLLSIYTAIYQAQLHPQSFEATPDRVKAAATHFYLRGFECERFYYGKTRVKDLPNHILPPEARVTPSFFRPGN